MAVVDWRSEAAYANFKKGESMDIAWEWLRRDAEYRQDYGKLTVGERSSGPADTYRQKWGLSFRG